MTDYIPLSVHGSTVTPDAWHKAMKEAYYSFSKTEREELHEWEKTGLHDGRGSVGDWWGWTQYIGPCPWLGGLLMGVRRVHLGVYMKLGKTYADEQADGFSGGQLIDTLRSSGTITIQVHREEKRWTIFERDNFTCLHCGSRRRLTIDHVVSRFNGGGDGMCNWQTLCYKCNSKKGKG